MVPHLKSPSRVPLLYLFFLASTLSACGSTLHSNNPAPETTFVGSPPDSPTPEAARAGALWYRIELIDERLDIRLRLLKPPPTATFFFPGRWAGREDFPRDIRLKGARTDLGTVPLSLDRSGGRIDVDAANARWLELAYDVQLHDQRTPETRFRAQLVDGVLFAYAPAILVLPSEGLVRQIRDIPIEVHLPKTWRTLATWTKVQRRASTQDAHTQVSGFLARDTFELRDAYLAASPTLSLQTHTLPNGHIMRAGFAPGLNLSRSAALAELAAVLRRYIHVFGSIGDVEVFLRPTPPDDRESRGVGRRGGFVLELASALNTHQRRMLIAHEALHLWNGHLLTPTRAAEPQTRWFKEGVTHYVALKTLNLLGMASRDDILAEVERSARYYARNPASRSGVSTDADLARIPYDRGLLLALAIDAMLTRTGQSDIHDWISNLLRVHHQGSPGYSLPVLREALLAVAGSSDEDLDSFWAQHITRNSHFSPDQMLVIAGLHWLRSSPGRPGRLLPIEARRELLHALFPGQLRALPPKDTGATP